VPHTLPRRHGIGRGLASGVIITIGRIAPFVVTLGMMNIAIDCMIENIRQRLQSPSTGQNHGAEELQRNVKQ
jgi:ribose/xylose/arabinose/galactoside ABC-type transport system permease subunit